MADKQSQCPKCASKCIATASDALAWECGSTRYPSRGLYRSPECKRRMWRHRAKKAEEEVERLEEKAALLESLLGWRPPAPAYEVTADTDGTPKEQSVPGSLTMDGLLALIHGCSWYQAMLTPQYITVKCPDHAETMYTWHSPTQTWQPKASG